MTKLVPSKLKVAELRKELSKRKLPTDGRRNELVERLKAALEEAEETQEETQTVAEAENEADDQIDLLPVDEQENMAMESTGEAEASAADGVAQEVDEQPAEQMEVEGAEAENERKRSHDEVDVAMSNEQETGVMDAVFIKNLERPLTKYRIREMLEKFGTVEDVWLNSIKTRGYARFGTAAQAEAACGKLNGMQFPPEHGRVLESGLITRRRMKELIEAEEARSDEVHTIDLVAVPHEGGNCGVALESKQGKGPAKRQKTGRAEGRGQADKAVADSAPMLVAAASAAASEAKSKQASQETAQDEPPRQTDAGEELRWTKTEPQITYRLLTDAEVAAKKAH
ncbi:hypothetical protein IWW36_003232 [Coemansia brasiliensis]|uniref:SAP domain-containing protein n=1 Tax=Coemansia brasiliensis TaxID=2650707 RepID=A0A9W8I853_9FUNG|nr:hypothetical protein IWW36_003232 [Coemansia brasiliensis]